jgi:hypothetical protein
MTVPADNTNSGKAPQSPISVALFQVGLRINNQMSSCGILEKGLGSKSSRHLKSESVFDDSTRVGAGSPRK